MRVYVQSSRAHELAPLRRLIAPHGAKRDGASPVRVYTRRVCIEVLKLSQSRVNRSERRMQLQALAPGVLASVGLALRRRLTVKVCHRLRPCARALLVSSNRVRRSWDYGGALIMDGMYQAAAYFDYGAEWHPELDTYLDGWTKDKTSDGYAMARNQTQPFGRLPLARTVPAHALCLVRRHPSTHPGIDAQLRAGQCAAPDVRFAPRVSKRTPARRASGLRRMRVHASV